MEIDIMDLNIKVLNFEKQYETSRIKHGKEIFYNEGVTITEVEQLNDNKFNIKARVDGKYNTWYQVNLSIQKDTVKKYSCTCEDYKKGYICKHILATSMEAIQPHRPSTAARRNKIAEEERKEREEKQRLYELQLERERKRREYERKYSEALKVLSQFRRINEVNYYDEKLDSSSDLKKLYQDAQLEKLEKESMVPALSKNLKIEPRVEILRWWRTRNFF